MMGTARRTTYPGIANRTLTKPIDTANRRTLKVYFDECVLVFTARGTPYEDVVYCCSKNTNYCSEVP